MKNLLHETLEFISAIWVSWNELSSFDDVTYGLPQGSVLILLFITDMSQFTMLMTMIYASGGNIPEAQQKLQNSMK